MRFRRKPDYIDAVQLTQEVVDSHVLDKVPMPDGCIVTSWDAHLSARRVNRAIVRLKTKNRDLVMPGDWILRHADGKFSVCKPEEFEKMYEAVQPEDAL